MSDTAFNNLALQELTNILRATPTLQDGLDAFRNGLATRDAALIAVGLSDLGRAGATLAQAHLRLETLAAVDSAATTQALLDFADWVKK